MWPEQPKGAKGKNVIIIEPRPKNAINKILIWEVTLIKTHDGKETLKITIEATKLGGCKRIVSDMLPRYDPSDRLLQRVRSVRHRTDPKILILSAHKWVLER